MIEFLHGQVGAVAPPAWKAWGAAAGSPTLRRLIGEGYSFTAQLRRELLDALVPELPIHRDLFAAPPPLPVERAAEPWTRWKLGDPKSPNEASFAVIDACFAAMRTCTVYPARTTLVVGGKMHRVEIDPGPGRVLACGLPVWIRSLEADVQISTAYIWARSDAKLKGARDDNQ